MRKIIITSGFDPRETEWKAVLDLTWPRFQRYADCHGYDFRPVWYEDIDQRMFPEFKNPGPFIGDAARRGSRLDFILWKYDRSMLAPNWLRYAAVLQLLDEYELIVYLDGDVLIAGMETDLAAGIPTEKWLASAICGPSPDNAGPGGPLFVTRSCEAAWSFWLKVWQGKKWITHPEWTDGVDFMDLLGYTVEPPVHKVRASEYDSAFYELPREWVAWGRNPAPAKAYHMGGGNAEPAGKAGDIARLIRERGL